MFETGPFLLGDVQLIQLQWRYAYLLHFYMIWYGICMLWYAISMLCYDILKNDMIWYATCIIWYGMLWYAML